MATSNSIETISASTALELVEAARAKAEEIGVPMSIWVLDPNGSPKAMLQMDGAAPVAIEMSRMKAVTAAKTTVPSGALFEFVKDDQAVLSAFTVGVGLVLVGGGYPLVADGRVIGAIGVSGGLVEQDMQCAEAAVALLS